MNNHRIYTTSVASVYPHYVTKAEKKGRTQGEVDTIICWLTGYSQAELQAQLEQQTDFETFFAQAPQLNPARALIISAESTGPSSRIRLRATIGPSNEAAANLFSE